VGVPGGPSGYGALAGPDVSGSLGGMGPSDPEPGPGSGPNPPAGRRLVQTWGRIESARARGRGGAPGCRRRRPEGANTGWRCEKYCLHGRSGRGPALQGESTARVGRSYGSPTHDVCHGVKGRGRHDCRVARVARLLLFGGRVAGRLQQRSRWRATHLHHPGSNPGTRGGPPARPGDQGEAWTHRGRPGLPRVAWGRGPLVSSDVAGRRRMCLSAPSGFEPTPGISWV
jgi:hypothetical protein